MDIYRDIVPTMKS
jgi:hypothetical protein